MIQHKQSFRNPVIIGMLANQQNISVRRILSNVTAAATHDIKSRMFDILEEVDHT